MKNETELSDFSGISNIPKIECQNSLFSTLNKPIK